MTAAVFDFKAIKAAMRPHGPLSEELRKEQAKPPQPETFLCHECQDRGLQHCQGWCGGLE